MQLMKEGAKWELYIPSELGYGDRGAGADIPGGAVLVFTLELLKVRAKYDEEYIICFWQWISAVREKITPYAPLPSFLLSDVVLIHLQVLGDYVKEDL